MIINHQHRFCFFAIPRTASNAISKVLIEQLGSEKILQMHTSYDEFMDTATVDEASFFTFATVRHPMDSIVSSYFKKKNDHNGRFSRGTFKRGKPIGEQAMKEYHFIQKNNADFSTYFKTFHQNSYAIPRHESTIEKVDAIIRYENLNEDFSAVLKQLNLSKVTIPSFNKTKGKEKHFMDYYTPEILPQAERVFSRLMKKWGYQIN